jgi:hypothetical protein
MNFASTNLVKILLSPTISTKILLKSLIHPWFPQICWRHLTVIYNFPLLGLLSCLSLTNMLYLHASTLVTCAYNKGYMCIFVSPHTLTVYTNVVRKISVGILGMLIAYIWRTKPMFENKQFTKFFISFASLHNNYFVGLFGL